MAPDAFQQTSILIQEVFNPSEDIGVPGSQWTRNIAGVYELTKFLFLFLVLDIVPIIIKVMGGDFGAGTSAARPTSVGKEPAGGPRPWSRGKHSAPAAGSLCDLDN